MARWQEDSQTAPAERKVWDYEYSAVRRALAGIHAVLDTTYKIHGFCATPFWAGFF